MSLRVFLRKSVTRGVLLVVRLAVRHSVTEVNRRLGKRVFLFGRCIETGYSTNALRRSSERSSSPAVTVRTTGPAALPSRPPGSKNSFVYEKRVPPAIGSRPYVTPARERIGPLPSHTTRRARWFSTTVHCTVKHLPASSRRWVSRDPCSSVPDGASSNDE